MYIIFTYALMLWFIGLLTWIVWPGEPELGVKDLFAGIPTLPSLSLSENAYRVLFTNTSVNTCNITHLEVKQWPIPTGL